MTPRRVITGISFLLAAALLAIPLPDLLPPGAQTALALTVAAVGLWSTGALPEHVTAVAFFMAADMTAVAPRETLFSGFASGGMWLVFAGLILAAGMRRTGLAERLAHTIARHAPGTYPGLIASLVVVGVALCIVMPSSVGRVALFLPIVAALADRYGFSAGSRGRTGMLFAACFGTILPGFAVLPSNVPNLVLVGASEHLYHLVPSYGAYLALHFPVTGVLKGILITLVVLALFPDRLAQRRGEAALAPASPAQRRLAVLLAITLVLWASDSWHGIAPAWIGLAAALLCVLPGMGLVTADDIGTGDQMKPMIHTAAIMGMGAMVAASGLGDVLSRVLLDVTDLAPGHDARNYVQIVASSSVIGLFTALTGMPAVMTPISDGLAAAAGLPLMTVLMMQVVAFSTVILPYQLPPLVIGIHLANLSPAQAAKMCLILAAITILLLAPANYYWFRILGYFP